MWERLELIIPRLVGAIGAGVATWGYAKGLRSMDEVTVAVLVELITVSTAAYATLHKLMSSKMNPGDAANVSVMQTQKAEEATHNESH